MKRRGRLEQQVRVSASPGALVAVGYDPCWSRWLRSLGLAGVDLARVARVDRGAVDTIAARGAIRVAVPKKIPDSAVALPVVVGDWCGIAPAGPGEAALVAIAPRTTLMVRKVAGARESSRPVVANVDIVYVVMGLEDDYSLRRLERYLVLIADSGARAGVILNKVDLCSNLERCIDEVSQRGVRPLVTNGRSGAGLEAFALAAGETCALVGSSGAGKSTLINAILGEDRLATRELRARDGRGQHTTTHRELFVVPGGGVIIDTPGLREVAVWGEPSSIDQVFPELAPYARECKFTDCRHHDEPGCALREAVEEGRVDAARFSSYLQLKDELAGSRVRQSEQARRKGEQQLSGRRRREQAQRSDENDE